MSSLSLLLVVPLVTLLEGSTVPGRAFHSAASRVNSIVSISLSSTNSTTLLGTTSSLGVQGVSDQYSSAVSVAIQQVR